MVNSSSKRGFTLIELLVVIAIIGILSSVVLASLNSARQRARDAQRLSDVREMSKVLAIETPGTPVALAGCTGAGVLTTTCTGPGQVSQFASFRDPSTPGTACTTTSTATCGYAIGNQTGAAAATTESYRILFYLEAGSGSLAAGIHAICGPNGVIANDTANDVTC